jgi:hypothetical protein
VEVKGSAIQVNSRRGVQYASEGGIVHLDECMVSRNKEVNIMADLGATVTLTNCTAADSLNYEGVKPIRKGGGSGGGQGVHLRERR